MSYCSCGRGNEADAVRGEREAVVVVAAAEVKGNEKTNWIQRKEREAVERGIEREREVVGIDRLPCLLLSPLLLLQSLSLCPFSRPPAPSVVAAVAAPSTHAHKHAKQSGPQQKQQQNRQATSTKLATEQIELKQKPFPSSEHAKSAKQQLIPGQEQLQASKSKSSTDKRWSTNAAAAAAACEFTGEFSHSSLALSLFFHSLFLSFS